MHFAIKCLIGMAVFASPCAYDTDPREPSGGRCNHHQSTAGGWPAQVGGSSNPFLEKLPALKP
jgi:hypothetical protein